MGILYRVKTDREWDECGAAFTVYGVTAYTAAGEILCTVPDLFFDREKAAAFVRLCRSEQPQPWALLEFAEDALAAQYGG